MMMEQIMAVGRTISRHIISGIMQRETSIPGTMAQRIDNNIIIPDKSCFASLFFHRKKRILKIRIIQEMMPIAVFALWQFI
jgi:hypothetical protein